MADYIEREYDVDAIPDVYCNTPDIDLNCEKLNCEKLEVENLKLYADDVTTARHWRWEVEVGMNLYKERNCPVCKKRIESNFWNYCPNCGAKMDGGC